MTTPKGAHVRLFKISTVSSLSLLVKSLKKRSNYLMILWMGLIIKR